MALAILLLCLLGGLVLVPLGLPGLWVMVLGVIAYGWLTAFHTVTGVIIGIALALALLGEIIEWWLGFRLARVYGGSRRAGWGALLGGLVGAFVGVPLPVIGSVIGAFLGACAGAALFEYTRERHAGKAMQAGWGALIGRVAVTVAKIGVGFAIAVVGVYAALRS